MLKYQYESALIMSLISSLLSYMLREYPYLDKRSIMNLQHLEYFEEEILGLRFNLSRSWYYLLLQEMH